MRRIFESGFDIVYLITVITLGIIMIKKGEKGSFSRVFGIMALVLGFGDAFHLVPRIYSLITDTMDANAAALGFGKLITAITMTIFYLILYYVWRKRYKITGNKVTTVIIVGLGLLRIVICLLPQNQWLSAEGPYAWGIYRNLPFLVMGLMMIILFYKEAEAHNDKIFSKMWLAITLSFAFYIPVVLFASAIPALGMLMIPKTVAYVWIVIMGYKTLSEDPIQ